MKVVEIDKKIANNIYNNILKLSNSFIKENDFFISKDYNSSFEIVSIFSNSEIPSA